MYFIDLTLYDTYVIFYSQYFVPGFFPELLQNEAPCTHVYLTVLSTEIMCKMNFMVTIYHASHAEMDRIISAHATPG